MYYIILIGVIVVLVTILFCFFGVMNSITKQLKEYNDGSTNKPVNVQIAFRPLNRLCNEINKSIQISKERELKTKRSDKLLKDSISNLSHDLRTPLTAILGYTTLLRKNSDKNTEYLNIIESKSKYLNNLIDEFYDLSLIEDDAYPMHFETVDIVAAVTDSLASFYSILSEAGIQLHADLVNKPMYGSVDRVSFERILSNLIHNAVKYAQGEIFVTVTESEEECIVSVSNPADQMDHIDVSDVFNRFTTGDTSRSNKSTGLGLYIVKTLCDKMETEISATKEDGLFKVTLWIKNVAR